MSTAIKKNPLVNIDEKTLVNMDEEYDYCVIYTSYLSRIMNDPRLLPEDISDDRDDSVDEYECLHCDILGTKCTLVSITDIGEFKLFGNKEDFDFCANSIPQFQSGMLLKNCTFRIMLHTINYLNTFNFCEYMATHFITSIKVYTYNGKKILAVDVDTSSG